MGHFHCPLLYVKGNMDDDPQLSDMMKKADSQQLIGLINQEYNLRSRSHKQEETKHPLKGEKRSPSLADWMSNNTNKTPCKKCQCRHCGKSGHHTLQCRHLRKNKCHNCDRYGHDANKCGQPPEAKCKTNDNNNSSNNKCPRTESQIADITNDNAKASANLSLHNQLVALHAEDDNYNVVDDEYKSVAKAKYNVHDLYDWLADSGTTANITHQRDTFTTCVNRSQKFPSRA